MWIKRSGLITWVKTMGGGVGGVGGVTYIDISSAGNQPAFMSCVLCFSWSPHDDTTGKHASYFTLCSCGGVAWRWLDICDTMVKCFVGIRCLPGLNKTQNMSN